MIHQLIRKVHTTFRVDGLTHNWPHLRAFVHVTSKRIKDDKISQSERLYLLSKRPTAEEAATLIRGPQKMKTGRSKIVCIGRWTPPMNDDQHLFNPWARKDHAPANFAALRRIALNIIKANTDKGSNRVKFKRAGWNNEFLKTLIKGF